MTLFTNDAFTYHKRMRRTNVAGKRVEKQQEKKQGKQQIHPHIQLKKQQFHAILCIKMKT